MQRSKFDMFNYAISNVYVEDKIESRMISLLYIVSAALNGIMVICYMRKTWDNIVTKASISTWMSNFNILRCLNFHKMEIFASNSGGHALFAWILSTAKKASWYYTCVSYLISGPLPPYGKTRGVPFTNMVQL